MAFKGLHPSFLSFRRPNFSLCVLNFLKIRYSISNRRVVEYRRDYAMELKWFVGCQSSDFAKVHFLTL